MLARAMIFAALIECYHNSFDAGVGPARHSPDFILNVLEAGDADTAKAALQLDPRLTSTDQGALAVAVAHRVRKDENLAKNFIDIELGEGVLVVTFDAKANEARITEALASVGKAGLLAKPGDKIGDGVSSDLFIYALEATPTVAEGLIAEMREAYKLDEDAAPVILADIKTVWEAECAILGLDPTRFGPDQLATRAVTLAQAKALFTEAYGESALQSLISQNMAGDNGLMATIPADEQGQRDRILRVMAGRGTLPGIMVANEGVCENAELKRVFGILATKIGERKLVATGKLRVTESDAVYADLADDLSVAIVEADDAAFVTSLFTRLVDTGMAVMTPARKSAISAKLTESFADAAKQARGLRGVARNILSAAGIIRPAIAEAAFAAQASVVKHGVPAVDPTVASLDAIFA